MHKENLESDSLISFPLEDNEQIKMQNWNLTHNP
jgi:hypothetical protein